MMTQEQAREIAEQLNVARKDIATPLQDGFQIRDFYALFGALTTSSPAFIALANATSGERALIAGEMFDLLTGEDDGALAANFIPGLLPAEEEQVLDLVKKIVVNKVATATA